MQLQQLVYFLAVARTRNFTRAAALVHVAQPSLSKQIHNLEHELGSELFHRARGNVSLTPAGEVLLPVARRILADIELARQQVHELAELRKGRLRLGATPSLCTGLVSEALARFHSRYPGIQLLVEESGSRDLVRLVTEGALDLAVLTSPPQRRDSTLSTIPILHEQLVVAIARDQEPGLDAFQIVDLRDRPLVMFREGYDLRAMTLAACQRAGFQPQFAIEGGEMDAVLSFVEVGLGVAVVPSTVLPGRPTLRGVPFVPPIPPRTITLAHRADVHPTRAAREFHSTLLSLLSAAAARHDLPSGVEFIPTTAATAQGHNDQCHNDQPDSGSSSSGQPSGPSSARTTRRASSSG